MDTMYMFVSWKAKETDRQLCTLISEGFTRVDQCREYEWKPCVFQHHPWSYHQSK